MSIEPSEPYYYLTVEDVKDRLRESLTSALEDWAPNHVNDGRVDSYQDWLDRVEGPFQMPDGTWVTLLIGDAYDEPQYLALKRLAKQIAKDL